MSVALTALSAETVSTPLLSHSDLDAPVARSAAGTVSAARFLSDVAALADRLPACEYLINLCQDRYRFVVAFAAAVTRCQVNLLPPSVAPGLLGELASAYPRLYAIVDAPLPECPMERFDYPHNLPEARAGVSAVESTRIAAIVFTSGSTGRPTPHAKTWGALVAGARSEARALGLLGARGVTVIGTVPPQHMYGLESTVLLPLHNGFALHAQRPFYPADIRAALEHTPGERVLVTTPVHLRALLAEESILPPLRLIVSATAPLAVSLAAQAEARYGAPLLEIYGFTEAGQVAWRRPSRAEEWHVFPDVRVRADAQGVRFSGGHVMHEAITSDHIEPLDAERFLLHGRGSDLVNVAGKRTSLAYLNHQLGEIDGVEDGVFCAPEEDEGQTVRRLTAFVVAPQLSREQVLAQLRRRIDPAFVPRPLHFVERLPRTAAGKLPHEALLALVRSRAPLREPAAVTRMMASDHAAAQGHFPGDPIIPGAVILDEVLAAAENQLGLGPAAWTVAHAKFLSPLRPGEALTIRFERRPGADLRFRCEAGTRLVASGVLLEGSAEAAE